MGIEQEETEGTGKGKLNRFSALCHLRFLMFKSFAKHFGDDEDQNGAAQTASGEQINQGIAGRGDYRRDGEHGYEDHNNLMLAVVVQGPLFLKHAGAL